MKKILLILSAFAVMAFGGDLEDGKKAYEDGAWESNIGNYKKAFELFKKAEAKGNTDGQFMLGLSYFEGMGVDKDYKEGVAIMQKAENNGSKDAAAVLGYAYYRGKGVEIDKIKAYKFLMKAAKEGGPNNTHVQNNLDSLCKESPWACK